MTKDINGKKKAISKISVHSNISFTSYAWILLNKLLCWINSLTREFMGKLFLFEPEMISAQFLSGNITLRGKL